MPLPSQGFSVNFGVEGLATKYFVVGPMAEGSWLRRIRIFWVAEAQTLLSIGLALGGVQEASAAAYIGAVGLIAPGDYVRHDKPAIGLLVGGSLGGWFDVPVGVQIKSGARWLLGVINSNIAEADVSIVVAVESLQSTKGERV